MKKEYVTARIYGEEFVANEYVAACYKIRCTTPNNNSYYTKIYDDTNGDGVYNSGDKKIYEATGMFGIPEQFRGCNEWHKGVIRDTAPAANGFVVKKEYGKEVAVPVFWWKENLQGYENYHVMVPGAENYETNPNAS